MAKFITGEAGTGKTTTVRDWNCILTATTGAAAVNLDCVTIHSALGYSKTDALIEKQRNGQLARNVTALHRKSGLASRLVIDECSMLEAEQLDIIHESVRINTGGKLEIVLVGDFAQLPPVDGKFAFEAQCWPAYEKNMTKLTTLYRQDEPAFLEALRVIRHGDGEGAHLLKAAGANFLTRLDKKFEGVTICPTNREADDMNAFRMMELPVSPITFLLSKSGQPEANKLVPMVTSLKEGARVMVTCNDTPHFAYANGDTGIVTKISHGIVQILLDRNGATVLVGQHTRKSFDYGKTPPQWLGEYTWMPVKPAYAMTIHKAQGLTIPRCQIPLNTESAQMYNLMYVACSRVRRASDLYFVGTVERLAECIRVHPKVQRWL